MNWLNTMPVELQSPLDRFFERNHINIILGNIHTILLSNHEDTLVMITPALKYFVNNIEIKVKAGSTRINLMDSLPYIKMGYSSVKGFILLLYLYIFFREKETGDNTEAFIVEYIHNYNVNDYLYENDIDPIFIEAFKNRKITANLEIPMSTLEIVERYSTDNSLTFAQNMIECNCSTMTTDDILDDDNILDILAQNKISKEIDFMDTMLKMVVSTNRAFIQQINEYAPDFIKFHSTHLIYYIMAVSASNKNINKELLHTYPTLNRGLYYILLKDVESVKNLKYTIDPRDDNHYLYFIAIKESNSQILQYIVDNIIYRNFIEKLVYLEYIKNYELCRDLYFYSRSLLTI